MTLFFTIAGYALLFLFLMFTVALFLSLGIFSRYDRELFLELRILFFRIKILPETEKKRREKEKPQAKKISPRQALETQDLNLLRLMLGDVLEAMGRLKRGIVVDDLSLDILIASSDPAETGFNYGMTCAATALLIPLLENNLRIKNRKIVVDSNFLSPCGHFKAAVCLHIRIWRLVLIALKLYLAYRKKEKIKDRAVSV